MARKRKTNYPIAGRPPKNPLQRVGTPARALFTDPVADMLREASSLHGIPDPLRGKISSDIVRLYIYWGLMKDGLLTDEIRQDPSWDTLKEKGLT
jgi:hypothetical protein